MSGWKENAVFEKFQTDKIQRDLRNGQLKMISRLSTRMREIRGKDTRKSDFTSLHSEIMF